VFFDKLDDTRGNPFREEGWENLDTFEMEKEEVPLNLVKGALIL